jgi:hypothetical protein
MKLWLYGVADNYYAGRLLYEDNRIWGEEMTFENNIYRNNIKLFGENNYIYEMSLNDFIALISTHNVINGKIRAQWCFRKFGGFFRLSFVH